ncbi:hypothetical protein MKW98_013892 [Papaver atlanticum]|uniref:Uncharacterized protein n=1 Tax=Papaver atlanticum TaxID=357466 RepID=A0AAD4SE36_9MAGN|nr:hypothetical protein MKW98_013892 [Papaver atlanticum]
MRNILFRLSSCHLLLWHEGSCWDSALFVAEGKALFSIAVVTKRNRRLTDGVIGEVLRAAQEATILPPWLHMLLKRTCEIEGPMELHA